MKKIDFYIIPMLTLLAVGIYKYRGQSDVQALRDPLHTEARFGRDVAPYLDQIKEQELSLVAIFDPIHDCPGCLEEAFLWVEPLQTCPNFNVIFLVPKDLPDSDIEALADSLKVSTDRFSRYAEGSSEAELHSSGVFKAMYSRSKGLLWQDHGNYTEVDKQKFKTRLAATIEQEGCPAP